jgi:hypothetical protein
MDKLSAPQAKGKTKEGITADAKRTRNDNKHVFPIFFFIFFTALTSLVLDSTNDSAEIHYTIITG